MRGANKASNKITALDFNSANFALFRQVFGRILWNVALERRGA